MRRVFPCPWNCNKGWQPKYKHNKQIWVRCGACNGQGYITKEVKSD